MGGMCILVSMVLILIVNVFANENNECATCMDDANEANDMPQIDTENNDIRIQVLPCGHGQLFHLKCIYRTSIRRSFCPLCNGRMDSTALRKFRPASFQHLFHDGRGSPPIMEGRPISPVPFESSGFNDLFRRSQEEEARRNGFDPSLSETWRATADSEIVRESYRRTAVRAQNI